ncbi:MAG: PEGA domain-containing protein [Bacteroidetes bacterium]|nr:PEGA domain-containing protein [Bacteroidota bacterium]
MKNLILIFLIPFLGLFITSCNSSDDPVAPIYTKGDIYITSNPAGAQIWIDGRNSSLLTPDTVVNVEEGVRTFTLKLQDYKDTTFVISVSAEQTSIVGPIALVSNIVTTLYSSVRIYETTNTTSSQPSGLDLSSGAAYGVSSPTNANLVDIYYSSEGFLVQSADLYPSLIRDTKFFVGSSSNLFDEVDSPDKNEGVWTNNIADRESNYVFLYDHDGHYSKLKIISWGGGVPGEPAWVEVQWYYNETQLDNRF